MATRAAQTCPHREATAALARGELTPAEQHSAEQHLEHCELCRAVFRLTTGDRFPKIRNYTILAELGRGGFGVVYKAIHHGKERVEALKVLFGKTALRAAYFENEVHLAARLRHPNIATLYEAHLRNPPLYYAMEFVEGQHLDAYLRSHEVSLEGRIKIVKCLAAAVDYAHQEGVIHRDLKPQNVLMDAQGQPRIVDFGIAKRLALADDDGDQPPESYPRSPAGVLGTFGYVAPEQMARQAVDARADIYGLGAVLFHVITGQSPRFAQRSQRLVQALRARQVSRADDLAAIIACCVHPVPEERYPSCAALVADLDNYVAGRPIRACRGPRPGHRLARMAALVVRNHPLPVQVALAAATACLLTAAFWGADARRLVPGSGPGQVALIAFTPSTLTAIRTGQIGGDLPGLRLRNRKSWRLLYGQLMEKLADADVRVVVWDYYFPDRQPDFDKGFIDGVEALQVPVVVGSAEFDLNAEPILCPEIRAAVHAWGALHAKDPAALRNEITLPLAVRRGFNPPTPSLVLAGFAATSFPDCDLDIRIEPRRLRFLYRKREAAAGELWWQEQTDQYPVFTIHETDPDEAAFKPGDKLILARFPLASVGHWGERAIRFEDVLTADAAQRREWFAGRAVLVGQMIPPYDQHRLQSGQRVFGCETQAQLLDALLAGTQIRCLSRRDLALRVCLWCVLAVVLANLVPVRDRCSLRTGTILGGTLLVLGIVLGLRLALVVTDPWAIEAGIAVCALLAASGPMLVVRLLHRRELHLTPGPIWLVEGTPTPRTALASSLRGSGT